MKNNVWIIGIILVILAGVFLNQAGFFTIFKGANKISCASINDKTWSCATYGLGGVGATGDKIYFSITKPSRGDDYRPMLFDKAYSQSSDFKEFIDTHTVIGWDSRQSNSFDCYEPYNSGWDTKLPGMTTHQYFSNYAWNLKYNVVKNILQKQFIIIEGTLTPQEANLQSKTFKTYGICDAWGKSCWVYDVENVGASDFMTADSITIYFKDGGYAEEDACSEFDINCPEEDITIYRFENNECNSYTILESERLSNDYDTLAECEANIIPEKQTYYRLKDDKCSEIELYPEEVTANDYLTLEKCEQGVEQKIICPEGFTYNETTNKCEKYPDVGIVCSKGTYNPDTGKCEVKPDIKEFDIIEFFNTKLFDIGSFEFKLWMLIAGIIALLILIPRR